MVDAMNGTYPNRMLTSDAKGRVCRVFDPPAWMFWAWIGWLFLPAEQKTIEERVVLVPAEIDAFGVETIRFIPRRRRIRLVVEAERAS